MSGLQKKETLALSYTLHAVKVKVKPKAKEKPKEGKVISVGTGKLLKDGSHAKFQVKKNDRIIFSSYAGTEVKIDGDEYLIMSEDDILAIT